MYKVTTKNFIEAIDGENIRVIATTNRDLEAEVDEGRFRRDLFYRLNVVPMELPPLLKRPEDIPDLVRHFLARFSAEEGKRIRAVSSEAVALLRGFSWPGNVRQLENAVFRAVVLAEGDELGPGGAGSRATGDHGLQPRRYCIHEGTVTLQPDAQLVWIRRLDGDLGDDRLRERCGDQPYLGLEPAVL